MNNDTEVVEVVEDVEKVAAEPEEHQEEPKDEKKYTDADVDKIINKKFAKWKEEAEKAEKEAEKLRKMNAEQKAEYEAKKQAEDLLKKAKSGEDFGELAKYHSNDTATVSKQGSLGWNSETNNNFVPEFKKAVSELKKGEISPLVKTEYGYHIIKKNDEKEYTFDEVRNNENKYKNGYSR